VAAVILSSLAAGAAPVIDALPATADGARLGVTIGIGVAGAGAAGATAIAATQQESFSSICAESSGSP